MDTIADAIVGAVVLFLMFCLIMLGLAGLIGNHVSYVNTQGCYVSGRDFHGFGWQGAECHHYATPSSNLK